MAARISLAFVLAVVCCQPAIAQQDSPAKKPPAAKAKPKPKTAAKADDLQKKWQQTVRKIAEARRAVAEAKNAEQRAAAQKTLTETTAELRRLSQQRTRAAQLMAYRVQGMGYAAAVRREVQADDQQERFLLLLPSGPLIVEADITIDGESFRKPREQLVDQLLAVAAVDGEPPRWDQAIKRPGFMLGQRVANDAMIKSLLSRYDIDMDERVNRHEVRAFLAQRFRGAAFTLNGRGSAMIARGSNLYRAGGSAATVDLWKLLDKDDDQVISAEELAAAPNRLKSRDADGNDLLYANEVQTGAAQPGRVQRINFATPQQRSRGLLATMLGPAADPESIWRAMLAVYGDDKQLLLGDIPNSKALEALDADRDGELRASELEALNDMPADLKLTICLGKTDQPSLAVDESSPSLRVAGKSSGSQSTFELDGVRLAVVINSAPKPNYRYDQVAKQYLTSYDKNKDGYLVVDEVPGRLGQFQIWDLDEDGKVYPKEIEKAMTNMQAPTWDSVHAGVSRASGALFQALDVSGDGRLGAREMKEAGTGLRSFDTNQDGKITKQEVPTTFRLIIGRGASQYRTIRVNRGPAAQTPAPVANGPQWFVRMDRNGDGDVTLKEFLGTPEAFAKLDTNQDGFIELTEAKATDK